MGLMIDGLWTFAGYDTAASGGRFVRTEAQFRNWITPDGAPGPTGIGGFAAEPGRYHLYVSNACPWAHRAMIYRAVKGLETMIGVSKVHWLMADDGWTFKPGEGVVPDPVGGATFLHEVYSAADPDYSGRVTVPVLWDLKTGTIVNNESGEIIRMFGSAFDGVGANKGDFYPEHLRDEIDSLNLRIYSSVNDGVYRAGFATTQAAYQEAVMPLFDMLDELDATLAARRYLLGAVITEADWRLLTTLLRFDLVYVDHFKCNLRRLVDYPNLWSYIRDLYAFPGVAGTMDFELAKRHYYESHLQLNPTGIVPVGPVIDFSVSHRRAGPSA